MSSEKPDPQTSSHQNSSPQFRTQGHSSSRSSDSDIFSHTVNNSRKMAQMHGFKVTQEGFHHRRNSIPIHLNPEVPGPVIQKGAGHGGTWEAEDVPIYSNKEKKYRARQEARERIAKHAARHRQYKNEMKKAYPWKHEREPYTQGRYYIYSGVKWTAAGPDDWDPKDFSTVFMDVLSTESWGSGLFFGYLCSNWKDIVGKELSEHTAPQKLENGCLTISATSTTWATQLRMLSTDILHRIGEQYGAHSKNTVSSLNIQGPQQRSYKKGKRHVKGRGPRDTYG